MLLQSLSQRKLFVARAARAWFTDGWPCHRTRWCASPLLERPSQFDRNVFATLCFQDEFSMPSFI